MVWVTSRRGPSDRGDRCPRQLAQTSPRSMLKMTFPEALPAASSAFTAHLISTARLMITADAPTKIPDAETKHGSKFGAEPSNSPPRIAIDATVTNDAYHQRITIALTSTNGRYGVNSQPVTAPFTAARTAVGIPIAKSAHRMAGPPVSCGARNHRVKAARFMLELPRDPLPTPSQHQSFGTATSAAVKISISPVRSAERIETRPARTTWRR